MKKIKTKLTQYFDLNQPYRFEVGDITAAIYTLCVIGVFCGVDMTLLFFIGSAIATAFSWQARRINLLILNLALFAMNIRNLVALWS